MLDAVKIVNENALELVRTCIIKLNDRSEAMSEVELDSGIEKVTTEMPDMDDKPSARGISKESISEIETDEKTLPQPQIVQISPHPGHRPQKVNEIFLLI